MMATTDSSFNAKGDTITAFETIDDASRDYGVKVHSNHICGVYGESMKDLPTVADRERDITRGTGVFGRGDVNGVEGRSDKIGVSGQSLNRHFTGKNASGIGVLGSSDLNRAGVFMGSGGSIADPDVDETLRSIESGPGQHPAQLRLVPPDDKAFTTRLPLNGLAGDFFVVMGGRNNEAILWFCVRSHDSTVTPTIPASWEQISSLGGIRKDGGTSAHL